MKVKIKKVPAKMQMGGPNYTKTSDPNIFRGKYGADITMDGFNESKKNGMPWTDFNSYADWTGSWAQKPTKTPAVSPYYRTYSGGNIPGGNIGLLMSQYKDNPAVMGILNRNIGKDGEVPMYGADDADIIRSLINKQRSTNNYLAVQEFGGQSSTGSLDVGRSPSAGMNTSGGFDYNTTLQPVPRDQASSELEKGESVVADFNNDGTKQHMTVGGKRHSQGGTPLNLPDDAFIFSDTRKLAMKGSEITPFGKSSKSTKSYTPADLAKQYDINKFKAIIDDPNADPIKKKTAEMMVDNYENKLAQLALTQEAKKGFPDGVPDIAANYLQTLNDNTTPSGGNIEQIAGKQMKFGGTLAKFVVGGDTPPDIDPYHGGKTKAGSITPTRQFNAYNKGKGYLKQWEDIIPGISKLDNTKAQELIYDYTLKNNPDAIKDMWSQYGLTNKGLANKDISKLSNNGVFDPSTLTPSVLSKLKSVYTDGYFGVRQLDPSGNQITPRVPGLNIPNPGFNNPSTLTPVTITPNSNTDSPDTPTRVPIGDFNPTQSKTPFDYMTPDKNNLFEAVSNRAGLKKYLPWEAPVDAVTANPTFYDPLRELANNSEQANTQMTFNNQFSGPQAVGARNSQVAGQSATNAANIISRYNNQNVGTSNQFSATNADVMNRLLEAKNKTAENLYTGNVIANQQFDNSVMQANNQIVKTANNAWNNRTNLGLVNDNNPFYYIDPTTGKSVFKGGIGLPTQPNIGQGKQVTYQDYYNKAKSEGYSEENAHKYAFQMANPKMATYTDKNADGIPDSVRYRGVIGPQ